MKKFGLAVVAAAAVGLFAGSAMAGSLSASKSAVTFGKLTALGAACVKVGNPTCDTGGTTDDTGWVTVMQTFIKAPNGKDLSFDVAMQTGLITYTEAKANGNSGSGKANAEGRIAVRVVATPVDNTNAPVGDPRFALPDNDAGGLLGTGNSEGDGVTYDYRFQELALTTSGLACLYDLDPTQPDCEIAVSLLLKTLAAHSFNFVLANVTSDIWRIEVQARATANATVFGDAENAKGEAFVGLGSTRVETLRLVKAFDPADGPLFDIIDLQ